MRNRRRQYGQLLSESLIAIIITSVAALIGATGVGFLVHANARIAAAASARQDVENLFDQYASSANSSIAIYTPTSCGGGSYGNGGACSSLRFLGKDSAGAYHYWGYDYNSSAQTLTPCLAYTSPYAACATAQKGRALTGVLLFTATPKFISTLSIPLLNGYTPTNRNYEMAGSALDSNCTGAYSSDTQCRLIAGNRVMVVDVGNAYVIREGHLLQGGAPFTTSALSGIYQPDQIGGQISTGSGIDPNPLWFWGMSAGSETENASEVNYGSYEAKSLVPSPWWFVATAPTCASVGWDTSSTTSDSTTYHALPTSVGSCAFTLASQDQTSPSIAAYVAGPMTPGTVASNAFSATGSVSFMQGNSTTVAGAKTYDANNLDVPPYTALSADGGGDLDQINFSGCSGYVNFSSPQTIVSGGTPSASYSWQQVMLTGLTPGSCTLTMFNVVTLESASMSITVTATPTPGPTPTPPAPPTPSPPPCSVIGYQCSYDITYAADMSPGCDGSGGSQSGYTGDGRATITPTDVGTWATSNGGASYTFTRTASGVVTVRVYSRYETAVANLRQSGGWSCTMSFKYVLTSSFIICPPPLPPSPSPTPLTSDCNASTGPCFMEWIAVDVSNNADCLTGVERCWTAYNYAVENSNGGQVDTAFGSYEGVYPIAFSNSSGNFYTPPNAGSYGFGSSNGMCDNAVIQTATQMNGYATAGYGSGGAWFEFVAPGSQYSSGETFDQYFLSNINYYSQSGPVNC